MGKQVANLWACSSAGERSRKLEGSLEWVTARGLLGTLMGLRASGVRQAGQKFWGKGRDSSALAKGASREEGRY